LTKLKLEAEFVSHPDSLARRLTDPAMGNSFGSYSEPGTRNTVAVKPKLFPWYEMLTTSRPNSDGGGLKAREVTV